MKVKNVAAISLKPLKNRRRKSSMRLLFVVEISLTVNCLLPSIDCSSQNLNIVMLVSPMALFSSAIVDCYLLSID